MTAPTSPSKKLGVKPGQRIVVLGAPDGVDLGPLPEGASVDTSATGALAPVVLVFVQGLAAVEASAPAALAAVAEHGVFWVAYPKGGKKAGTDLNRDILWAKMGEYGLTGVNLVAIDSTWSAMRFRPASEVGT